jgi:hypothetical protein
MIDRTFRVLFRRIAARRPPDFVVGDRGMPYLRRWFVIPRNRVFNIYLHEFLRSDDDRALHDHPWPSVSLLLRGRLVEHTIAAGGIHHHRAVQTGALRFRMPRFAHRIEIVPGESAWTLFITGPSVRAWGFHCPQGWRTWQDFTAPGKPGETGRGCSESAAPNHHGD